jgi:hypothetical protein
MFRYKPREAIASLLLGLLSAAMIVVSGSLVGHELQLRVLSLWPGVAAVVLGVRALIEWGRSDGLEGEYMAFWGIYLGGCFPAYVVVRVFAGHHTAEQVALAWLAFPFVTVGLVFVGLWLLYWSRALIGTIVFAILGVLFFGGVGLIGTTPPDDGEGSAVRLTYEGHTGDYRLGDAIFVLARPVGRDAYARVRDYDVGRASVRAEGRFIAKVDTTRGVRLVIVVLRMPAAIARSCGRRYHCMRRLQSHGTHAFPRLRVIDVRRDGPF